MTVVVPDGLPAGALAPLAGHTVVVQADRSPAALADAAASADALVTLLTDEVSAAVLSAGAGGLRVVANVAAGFDNVDVAAAHALGITVCTTPGVLDESTAELALTLALMARRRTTEAETALREGRWTGWAIDGFLGHDLAGATMGVVGWGRIGRAVGRRAAALGLRVIHTRPTPLEELLATADVVSLHVPLTPETHHLISAPQLRLMKPTAVLVNTARGAVVDEAALAAALHDGVIAGAGLDVYASEPAVHPRLLTAPGAVLLPHIGSATVATRTAMARTAAAAVADVLAGRPSAAALAPTATSVVPTASPEIP